MKKILFLLLSTIAMYGQVPADATQLENIQITNNVQDLTAEKVNVQSTNGVLNWQLINDFQNNKPYFSTGLLKNGLLTINADNTKFDLSAGIGVHSDFSDPENVTSKVFNFPAFNAVLSPYLATSNITYVAVNYNGGTPTIVMQASKFSNTQLRDLVVVGAVVHSNFTTINTINNISSPSNDVGNSVADLFNFLGAKNQEGNVYSANGANLQLNKSAGTILKYGANFHVDSKNPHNVFLPEQLSLTFRYRLRGGFEGTDRINIDTGNYDLNNVLTTVPPAKPYQIQTIFIPQTGQTRLQYGQDTYSTLADAIAAINTRKFVTETNLASQFVKVAYLVVKKGATSLNVAADADIRQATQFDGTASGGVAITYQSIIDALGYVPENVSNKVTDISVGANNTTYPTSLAAKTYIDNIVVGMLNDRGTWDASSNLFPTTGGSGTAGAIRKGDMWYVSVAGILGGKAVNIGDSFRALVNDPAQTAANWSVLEANIGYVPENQGNKSSSYTVSSTTTYPDTKALVDGLAIKQANLSGTGIVKSTTGTISYLADNSTNWNTAFSWGNHAGLYHRLLPGLLSANTLNVTASASQSLYYLNLLNSPYSSSQDYIGSIVNIGGKSTGFDLASMSLSRNRAYLRTYDNGAARNWAEILTADSYNVFSPSLIGAGATGSWNINASTATTLQTARNFTIGSTAKSFNGSANVSWSLAEIGAEPIVSAGTTADYYRGDKTWQPLNKAAVGLSNVDNTSDANKPISTATQTALDSKAPLNNPTFTGSVKVPDATLATEAVNKGQLDAAVRPYKVYTAVILQTLTNNPQVQVVLENSIGDIVWVRTGIGKYTGTLAGAFTGINKLAAFISNLGNSINSTTGLNTKLNKINSDSVEITTESGQSLADGVLYNASVEIRVYN